MSATVNRTGESIRKMCEAVIANVDLAWERDKQIFLDRKEIEYQEDMMKYEAKNWWQRIGWYLPQRRDFEEKTSKGVPAIWSHGWPDISQEGYKDKQFAIKALLVVTNNDIVTISVSQLNSLRLWA